MTPTFLEELLLLLSADEKSLVLRPDLTPWLDTATAGALLMDLALRNHIDSDPRQLVVVDTRPTGEPLLDGALDVLGGHPPAGAIDTYVAALARHGERFRAAAVDRLCARGILKRQRGRRFWVFSTHAYPLVDGGAAAAVRARTVAILFGDEIPDPRDVVLISLVSACDLLPALLSPDECVRVRERVALLRRMDLIGQRVGRAIGDIRSVGQAIRHIEGTLALSRAGI